MGMKAADDTQFDEGMAGNAVKVLHNTNQAETAQPLDPHVACIGVCFICCIGRCYMYPTRTQKEQKHTVNLASSGA
jgi:hypothetical protein